MHYIMYMIHENTHTSQVCYAHMMPSNSNTSKDATKAESNEETMRRNSLVPCSFVARH